MLFKNLFSGNKKFRPQPSQAKPRKQINNVKSEDPLLSNLAQVGVYRSKIETMTHQAEPDSLARLRLEQLNAQVQHWHRTIEDIVMRTLSQEGNELLESEYKQVPKAIKRLEKQLATTDNKALRQKLQITLQSRRSQLVALEKKKANRQLVELKVENTLAQLSTIYAQLHTGQYMAGRSSYERLAADISDEVNRLDDYLTTLDELQQPALLQIG